MVAALESVSIEPRLASVAHAPYIGTHAKAVLQNQVNSSHHSFNDAQKVGWVKYINQTLSSEEYLKSVLPIDPQGDNIFEAVSDGILLCQLINKAIPDTIDESRMNVKFRAGSKKYQMLENQSLVIEGAKKIGCTVVNLGPPDLMQGKHYLILGLLWQIIKIGMLANVTVQKHPELMKLVEGEENIADLPPEDLLIRWVNFHLKKSACQTRLNNFHTDVMNSSCYIHLMNRLNPEICTLNAMQEDDMLKRAELTLEMASKIDCRSVLTAQDIVDGNERLNLLFVANMFHEQSKSMPDEMEALDTENERLNAALQEEKMRADNLAQQQSITITKMNQAQLSQQELIKYKEEVEMQCQQMNKDNQTLLLTKESLLKDMKELKKQLQRALESERQLMSINVTDKAELTHLKKDHQKVRDQSQYLQHQLQTTQNQLQNAVDELKEEKSSLLTAELSGENLSADMEKLKNRQEKLEYLIEHLKTERIRSEAHVERLRVLYNSFGTAEDLCLAIYKTTNLDIIEVGCSKSGFLTKKARHSNNWKYRYFVLRDNFLFYYKSDKDRNAPANGAVR